MRAKMKNENLAIRLGAYFFGLFLMTLGVSMSVKSNLGVSPVSSIYHHLYYRTGNGKGNHSIPRISCGVADFNFKKSIP